MIRSGKLHTTMYSSFPTCTILDKTFWDTSRFSRIFVSEFAVKLKHTHGLNKICPPPPPPRTKLRALAFARYVKGVSLVTPNTVQVNRDQAQFSFRFVNNILAGKAKGYF